MSMSSSTASATTYSSLPPSPRSTLDLDIAEYSWSLVHSSSCPGFTTSSSSTGDHDLPASYVTNPIEEVPIIDSSSKYSCVITSQISGILGVAVSMALGLLSLRSNSLVTSAVLVAAAVFLSLGFVAVWNGILLSVKLQVITSSNIVVVLLQVVGIGFMLLVFFVFVAAVLPLKFIWFPSLCWLLCIVPFLQAFFLNYKSSATAAPARLPV